MVTLPRTLNTPQPAAHGYHLSLGTLLLQAAATRDQPVGIATQPADAPRVDTGVNPDDMTAREGNVFSRISFEGGDGLRLAHRPDGDPSDASRYWSGWQTEVVAEDPGDRPSYVTLARDMPWVSYGTLWQTQFGYQYAHISPDRATQMVVYDGFVWWPGPQDSGTVLRAVVSGEGVATAFTNNHVSELDVFPGAQAGIAVHDDDVHVGSYVYGVKRYASGAWSTVNADALVTDGLWSVKRRLLYGDGSYALRDVDDPATAIVVGGSHWVSVVDAGEFVLAANQDGYVYALTWNAETSAWILQGQSQVQTGATPTALAYASGIVLVGTERKTVQPTKSVSGTHGSLWTADLNGAGGLENIDLIRHWDTRVPQAFTQSGSSVLAVVYPEILRFDLVTGGLHPHGTLSDAGALSDKMAGWAIVAGRSNETVADLDFERLFVLCGGYFSPGTSLTQTSKLWATSPERESNAFLQLPYADFYSADDKVWLEITAHGEWINERTGDKVVIPEAGTGPTGGIELWLDPAAVPEATDGNRLRDTGFLYVGKLDRDNQLSGVFSLLGAFPRVGAGATEVVPSRFAGIRAWFQRADPDYEDENIVPALLSVAIRAVGYSGDEQTFQIPVNVSDMHERPYRKPVHIPELGETLWQELKAQEGKHLSIELFRPATTITGVLSSVGTRIPGFTPRGSATTVTVLTVTGQKS